LDYTLVNFQDETKSVYTQQKLESKMENPVKGQIMERKVAPMVPRSFLLRTDDCVALRVARSTKKGARVESVLRLSLLWGAAIGVFALAPSAFADSINFSTNTGGWTVTGAGATNAPAFVLGTGAISLTSNATNTGTFVTGGSLGSFDGFWTASFSFFLPAGATNISGSFSGLTADDRVVLYINGNQIGDGGLEIPASGSVIGMMQLTDGGTNQSFTFNSADSSGSESGSTGLILGGENTLTAVINNTGGGIYGTTKTFGGTGDGTNFGVTGELSYTNSVPEPSSVSMLLGGLALLGGLRRKMTRA
jgi:hypothetical protein